MIVRGDGGRLWRALAACALTISTVAAAGGAMAAGGTGHPSEDEGQLRDSSQAQAQARDQAADGRAREDRTATERVRPERVAARQQSRHGFAGESRDQALATARDELHIERMGFEQPDGLVRHVGEHVAVVRNGQRNVVLVSNQPLLTPGANPVPVDLMMQPIAGGFAPSDPVVPLRVAGRPSDGTLMADVTFAPDQAAVTEAGVAVADKAFFANVATDADYTVAGTPEGAEASWILRSDQAPEQYGLRFSLPLGAVLLPSTSVQGQFEIRRGGGVLATILPALAHDADGTPIPVDMQAIGDRLTIAIGHRGLDIRYPAVLDPTLIYGSYGSPPTNTWVGWDQADLNCGGINMYANTHIWTEFSPGFVYAGCEGRWRYHAPGTAYVFQADIGPFDHSTGAVNDNAAWYGIVKSDGTAYPDSHFYVDGNYPSSGTNPVMEFNSQVNQYRRLCIHDHGGAAWGNNGCPDPGPDNGVATSTLRNNITYFGLYNALSKSYSQSQYADLRGASLRMSDMSQPDYPTVNVPSGWVNTVPASYTVTGHDGGIGINTVTINAPGLTSAGQATKTVDCNTFTTPPAYSPCPQNPIATFPINQDPVDGIYTITATSSTPLKTGPWTPQAAQLKIDRIRPALTTAGSLKEFADELVDGTYTLGIDASDNAGASQYSGVARVDVFVDSNPTPLATWMQSCENCALPHKDWSFSSAGLSGDHTIHVVATDGAQNTRTEDINITIPADCSVDPGQVADAETDPNQSCSSDPQSLAYDSSVGSQPESMPLAGGLLAPAPAVSLRPIRSLLENVPDPTTGGTPTPADNSIFDAKATGDSSPMGQVDIIANPEITTPGQQEKYLAVYQSDPGGDAADRLSVKLAGSDDLLRWKLITTLEDHAQAPTLRVLPGGGFLLANEVALKTGVDSGGNRWANSNLRLAYYTSYATLRSHTESAHRVFMRRFSHPYPSSPERGNEGTPDLRSITWNGSLSNSTIVMGFHYLARIGRGGATADREAEGTLDNGAWSVRHLPGVRKALIVAGFRGNHGQRRQFRYGSKTWRIYEAQLRRADAGSWRLILEDVAAQKFVALKILTPANRRSACSMPAPTDQGAPDPDCTVAFSSPATVALLPDPDPTRAGSSTFVASSYIFGEGAAQAPAPREAGALIYIHSPYS